jgi:hypothetical protein
MSTVQVVTNLDGDFHIDELTHFCPGRGATIVYVSKSKSNLPFQPATTSNHSASWQQSVA